MSEKSGKIYIFFDTNYVEYQDYKRLDEFEFNSNFGSCRELINIFGLDRNVVFCITRVVYEEIIQHYIETFKRESESIDETVVKMKRLYGRLLEKEFEFKLGLSQKEYIEFIRRGSEEYIKNNYIQIIDFPADYSRVVENALRKRKPFISFYIGKKEYSDGGFKDALLWESIVCQKYEMQDIIILMTNDNVFDDTLAKRDINNAYIIRSNDSLRDKLAQLLNINLDFFEINKYLKTVSIEYLNQKLIEFISSDFPYWDLMDLSVNNVATKIRKLNVESDQSVHLVGDDDIDVYNIPHDIAGEYYYIEGIVDIVVQIHEKDYQLKNVQIAYEVFQNEVIWSEIKYEYVADLIRRTYGVAV